MKATLLVSVLTLSLVLTGCPEQKPGVPPPPLPAAPSPPPEPDDKPRPDAGPPQLPLSSGSVDPPPANADEPKPPEPPPQKPDEPKAEPKDELEVRLDKLSARPTSPGVLESVLKDDKHLRVYPKEKRLELDGVTCLKRGPYLELLACTRHGKTHESLLIWFCDPEKLHLALILLGLKPSAQVKEFGEEKTLTGDKVTIEVEWAKDPKRVAGEPGAATERRAVEELIFDQKRNGPMQRAGWIFTGSTTIDEFLPPDFKTAKKSYAATLTGTVCVTFHDPAAVLDTALEGSQSTYIPWSDRLPERFTPAIIHIRPWREGDEKEEPIDPSKIVKPDGGGAPGGGAPSPGGR